MTVFVGILTFFVILATLILVHELGHFCMAKSFGVRVDEFGLGFPPRVKAWRRGVTTYSINMIPLGGFVKMRGENGESADTDSFGSKPHWQRLTILVSGPAMNLLLSVVISFFAFMGGSPRGLPIVTGVSLNSPASTAGLQTNDRILSADGQTVTYLADLQTVTFDHLGQSVTLRVQRGTRRFSTMVVPRTHPPAGQGPIGISLEKTVTISYGPKDALQHSIQQVGAFVASLPLIVQSLSQQGGNTVSGPIGIAQVTTKVVHDEPRQGIGSVLQFMAFLSADLGILNLLPIPALDGGRIFFVLISLVRRRNMDPELEGVIHMIGMAALLLLILVISYNDIARLVGGGGF